MSWVRDQGIELTAVVTREGVPMVVVEAGPLCGFRVDSATARELAHRLMFAADRADELATTPPGTGESHRNICMACGLSFPYEMNVCPHCEQGQIGKGVAS